MRLESLTLRGFMTAFAGRQVTVPIGQLPDGLIAITGDNGAGKSTLMEAAAAGIYRQFMSRDGDLKTYAQDRDSAIETSWSLGDEFIQSRLTIDGVKGGASAALWKSGDQIKQLNDGKVSTFDAAVAHRFPPLHVFKASAFAAQNKSGSFVHASKKDRRDIFNAFLNLDRLVAMSDTAKACAAEVDKVRLQLKSELTVLESDISIGRSHDLPRQIAELEVQGLAAERRREELAIAIEQTEQQLAVLSDSIAAAAVWRDKVGQLQDRLAVAQRELAAHLTGNAETVSGEGRELQKLRSDRAIELAAIDAKREDITVKLAGNKQIQDMAAEIRAAVTTLQELAPQLDAARAALDQLRAGERDLASKQAGCEKTIADFTKPQHELDRAKKDAELLEHVPCHGAGEFAACQLLVNAAAAKARIAELEFILSGLTGALQLREALAAEIRTTADAIDKKLQQLRDLETRQKAAQPKAAYADKLAASEARVEELHRQHEELIADRDRLVDSWTQRERAMLERHAERGVAALAAGDVLATKVQVLDAERYAAVIQMREVTEGNQAAAALQATLNQQRADRDAAITAIATAATDIQVVTKRASELQQKVERLELLRGRLAKLDTELLEWQRLQQALGRDGLPALETDQAGPEISALTNQILADCFESRFSVELVTQVAKADGKGMKDEFTLLVTDNQTGQQRDIADLSGGEEVVISEAFMNAIALYINERSATRMLTFFRDETTGALTKENTQRYVQMLRKVQALGGIRQIVFISHDPDATALADAQIRVAGGSVSTVLPPYMAA